MCVYDDVKGWNTLPYRAGEFYLEFMILTLPLQPCKSYCKLGELVNPSEVYTAEQLNRWALAAKSDKTVVIRSAAEVTNTT
jgi:hypothetical protein